MAEVEAEKTPRVLSWGGNLVIKNYKVIEELDELPHAHKASVLDSKIEVVRNESDVEKRFMRLP